MKSKVTLLQRIESCVKGISSRIMGSLLQCSSAAITPWSHWKMPRLNHDGLLPRGCVGPTRALQPWAGYWAWLGTDCPICTSCNNTNPMRLLWGVTEFIMKALDTCLERARIQYMVAMTRCCDDDDDDEFLFSPLPQSAQKTPLLPRWYSTWTSKFLLKQELVERPPPPSKAFLPGSPLLSTQMNRHLLSAAKCWVCSIPRMFSALLSEWIPSWQIMTSLRKSTSKTSPTWL